MIKVWKQTQSSYAQSSEFEPTVHWDEEVELDLQDRKPRQLERE